MKARNNKTGEIVTNFTWSGEWGTASYINSEGLLCISNTNDGEWTMIEESDDNTFDWETFRRETAKSVMCSLITRDKYFENHSDEDIARLSIASSDELIRQLKKKKK